MPAAGVGGATLGAACPLLLAALSARIFRHRGLAIATGVLAAIHPALGLAVAGPRVEPLFVAPLLSSGYLLLAATDRPSSNLAVLAGVLFALAVLAQSSALWFAPLLLAPLFDRRHPRRADVHIAFSAIFGFAAAIAPWMLQNAMDHRELFRFGAGGDLHVRDAGAAIGPTQGDDRIERLRGRPGPGVLASRGAFVALLCLAGIGFARGERGGVRFFGLAFLAASLLVHVVLRSDWGQAIAFGGPVLLLYAAFGGTSLLAPRAAPVAA